ncbi:MAG: adenylate/guanylate cyclase domain-containing protein [Betaproteobacteria bacterium]
MATTERKMAAILAMDVVSYSEKMGRDEEGTLRHLRACREIIEGVVAENRGRIFNTAGDAFMIEFASAVSAVSAAVDIQKPIQSRNESLSQDQAMQFRIGINVGDIIIEGENLYGEGVNIAARLESIASPGGISLSEKVYSEVRRKFNFAFEDTGIHELKNIEEPVRVFQVNVSEPTISGSGFGSGKTSTKSLKSSKFNPKSIVFIIVLSVVVLAAVMFGYLNGSKTDGGNLALNTILVLPIQLSEEDKELKNFAAGLAQDLSNELSSISKNLNIVRSSQRGTDASTAGKQAGAQYVVDGNLRKSGEKFRLSVSLLDTTSNSIIWSKSFDRKISTEDIFSTQDEIVSSIVREMAGNSGSALTKDIAQRAIKKGSVNLSAYECVNYARGTYLVTVQPDDYPKVLKCLKEAVNTDPSYVDAKITLAVILRFGYLSGSLKDASVIDEAIRLIDDGIVIEPKNAQLYSTKGTLFFAKKDWPAMYAAFDRAYELAPNNVAVLSSISSYTIWGGDCTEDQVKDFQASGGKYTTGNCRWQKGFEIAKKADELDKANTVVGKHYGLTYVLILAGKYDQALQQIQKVPAPGFIWYEIHSGLIHAKLGSKSSAGRHFEAVKKLIGSSKLKDVQSHFYFYNMEKTGWNIYRPTFEQYGFN